MNPYERRIIHTTVQEMEGVISWSVGSDDRRHVIIGPSDDNPNKDKAGRGERSGRGNRGGRGGRDRGERRPRRDSDYQVTAPERPVREFVSRSYSLPVAEDVAPVRTNSEKEDQASLYGRIEF